MELYSRMIKNVLVLYHVPFVVELCAICGHCSISLSKRILFRTVASSCLRHFCIVLFCRALCCVLLCCVMSCRVRLCCFAICCAVFRDVLLRRVGSCCVVLFMLRRVVL